MILMLSAPGIAEALLMAGRLLQTDDFAPAAADALTFEAESYCEPLGNWLDRRVPGVKKVQRETVTGPKAFLPAGYRLRRMASVEQEICIKKGENE